MNAGASTNAKPIACPRCGYDQRGAMATWRESCPLEGTCAECGLTFGWADVFDPLRAMPRWCIERDCGRWRWPLQFVRTTLRAWFPSALWQPLRMSHRHNWQRQAGYVLTWLIATWIVIALCNGFLAYAAASVNRAVLRQSTYTEAWAYALMASATPWDGEVSYFMRRLLRQWPPLLGLLSIPITTALTFALLPVSRRRAKVRWWHIRRAAAYLFGIVAIVIGLIITSRALGRNDFIDLARTSRPTVFSQFVAAGSALTTTVTVVTCVWLPFVVFWYWHACVRRHLRMDQSWAVALSVVAIGALASCAIGYWAGQWLK